MNIIFWYRKIIPLIFCVIFFIIFMICNAWFNKTGFWLQFKEFSPAYSFTCEYQNPVSIIRQPLNTFSNFLLLYFGIEIVIFSWYDRKHYQNSPNLVRMNYQYSLVFGLSLVWLFLGSTVYHASMLDFFSQLDMAGVYACLLFPIIMTIHKIIAATYFGNKPYFSYWGSLVSIISFFIVLYYLTGYYWNAESYLFVPLLFFCLFALSAYHNYYYVKDYRKDFLTIALVSILIALSFYGLDIYYCFELSYFQFHSLWHIFAALSMYYYYLYLRSEQNLVIEKVDE